MNIIQRLTTAVLLATGIVCTSQKNIKDITHNNIQEIEDIFVATEVDSNPGDIKVTMENIIKIWNYNHKLNEATIAWVGHDWEKITLTKISPEHFTLTIDGAPYQITYDNSKNNWAYDLPATFSQDGIGSIDLYLYDIMSQVGLFHNWQTLRDVYGEQSFQIAIDNEIPMYYVSQEDPNTEIYLNTLEEVNVARSKWNTIIVLVKPGTVMPS